MFATPHQITQSREHALINMLGLSTAWINANQRLSALLAEVGRQRLEHGNQHLEVLSRGEFDALTKLWLDHAPATQFIEQIYGIVSDTHKAMIEAAEAQVRAFDEIVFASIERARNFSPWEADIAWGAMRSTLESAEHTLHDMSAAAIQTVELAEQEIHQVSESLAEKTKTSSTRKTRTKAE